MSERKCKLCRKVLPIDAFGRWSAGVGRSGLRHQCRPCFNARIRASNNKYQRASYHRNRAILDEHLASHPCVDCGEADPIVLEFDHREPSEKWKAVSCMMTHAVDAVLSEIAKCDIRCCNCHRRRTVRERHHLSRRAS